ncbi:DTW domain-containing protein 1 [Platysternon megacephalum]|uniref:DTW domain-containing protein 1 n=1 Tax=Platysternon megacephalum TaxID=55544 RepID=A0A4D9ERM5_9SAUR|nr:DTW domain-containing protein 1 [Platysternon megacephalum]
MSSSTIALAPVAKNVMVYRNGDSFFHGRKFVVNQRQFLTFEAFLNELTSTIHASVAVRNIYTPRQGHRVTELEELQNGCPYVAAGFERFKRLDYLNPGMKQLSGSRKKNGLQIRPGVPQKLNMAARWQKHVHLPCIIHVFRNGDLLSPPFRLLLSKSTLQEWDAILGLLTEKANLRSGAVRKLCQLDGVPVSSGEELVNGEYYVAVGVEKYKNLPYFELLVPKNSVHRALRNHPNNRRRIHNRGFGKSNATSQDGASDSALIDPPQQPDYRRVQSTGAAEKDKTPVPSPAVRRQAGKYPRKEEESVFHAKPVRAGQNRTNSRNIEHWPDQEEGSVYKVKDPRKEMRGAREVVEDEYTKMELPVDQRAAETVEEVIPKNKMTPHSKNLPSYDCDYQSQRVTERHRQGQIIPVHESRLNKLSVRKLGSTLLKGPVSSVLWPSQSQLEMCWHQTQISLHFWHSPHATSLEPCGICALDHNLQGVVSKRELSSFKEPGYIMSWEAAATRSMNNWACLCIQGP